MRVSRELLPTLVFEAVSLPAPGAQQFGYVGGEPWGLPVPLLSARIMEAHGHTLLLSWVLGHRT